MRFLGDDFAIYMNSQRGEDGVEVAAVLEGFERKAIHRRSGYGRCPLCHGMIWALRRSAMGSKYPLQAHPVMK